MERYDINAEHLYSEKITPLRINADDAPYLRIGPLYVHGSLEEIREAVKRIARAAGLTVSDNQG